MQLYKSNFTESLTSVLKSIENRKEIHSHFLGGNKVSKKIKIFRPFVERCVTYRSEVWTIREEMKRRINVIGFWRRSCGVIEMRKLEQEWE